MATTTNLNLVKPAPTDNVDVSVFNENFDKIDDAITNNIKVLWANSAPSNDFSAQAITLNENISNFRFYFIKYALHKSYNTKSSTGLIPIGDSTNLIGAKNTLASRDTSAPSGTELRFADCTLWTYNETGTTSNSYCVPLVVFGVK